jgi:hypothetical protein
MPGVGGHYPHENSHQYQHASSGAPPASIQQGANYYPQAQQSNYEGFVNSTQPMAPPLSSNGSFVNQQSPTSPTFTMSSQQTPPMSNIGNVPSTTVSTMAQLQPSFGLDATDPGLFNIDISSFNFGNQYGAMEFGMLGHMAGGAADSPTNDNHLLGSIQMPHFGSISSSSVFADSHGPSAMYNQDPTIGSEWQGIHPRQNSTSSQFNPVYSNRDANRPESVGSNAYVIGTSSGSIHSASPVSTNQEYQPIFDGAPSSPAIYSSDNRQTYSSKAGRPSVAFQTPQPAPAQKEIGAQAFRNAVQPSRKRRRDYSYDQVTAPYSYTEGFHSLQSFLQKRYSTDKRVRIARALTQFRPTLIHTYGQKSRADLIFTEKVFQRALCEYEEFSQVYGHPSIILRRTGEVALANKEFCIVTGWKNDVLLGKEPNLNANFGGSTGHHTGNSTRGAVNTPRLSTLDANGKTVEASKPRPVLIAELLDHEAVVQFWEDCAELAYVDPHGGYQRPCNLIKYRPKEASASYNALADIDGNENAASGASDAADGKPSSKRIKREAAEPGLKSEADLLALGEVEGTVPCMYTWKIVRDVFDAPMMFILNVSGQGILMTHDSLLTFAQFLVRDFDGLK